MYNLAGGGAERTVVNLINNLDKKKYEILLVIGSNNHNDYIELIDNTVEIINLNASRQREALFRLAKIIRKNTPDLMFTTINKNNIVLSLAKMISLKRIPIVIREANNRTQSGKVTYTNKCFTRIIYNYIPTVIIALSKGVREDLIRNFHVNKRKIEVIYNPIELKNIVKIKGEELVDIKINSNEKLIIAVGKLEEQKDYPTLLKAFNLIVKEIKVKLVILGKGPYEKQLKELTKDLGLENSIKFVGFQNNPYKYMNIADLFILTSKWEGFGHVIVEAMATGVPVISTDCNSGPAEIIEKKYGILVEVGDYKKIATEAIEILSNDRKHEKLKELGYRRAQDFEASKIIKEYDIIFSQILSS